MKARSSLKRRAPVRDENPLYLIVCEGIVTEKRYFSDLRREFRVSIDFEFVAGGVPLTLVQKAAERKRKGEFDAVWVLFDIDDHPNIAGATDMARANGLRLAVSNPCFELWALLHFQDQQAHIERDRLRVLLRTHIPGYEKELPTAAMKPLTDNAVARAEALRVRHQRNGTTGDNPSTDADILVGALLKAARP